MVDNVKKIDGLFSVDYSTKRRTTGVTTSHQTCYKAKVKGNRLGSPCARLDALFERHESYHTRSRRLEGEHITGIFGIAPNVSQA